MRTYSEIKDLHGSQLTPNENKKLILVNMKYHDEQVIDGMDDELISRHHSEYMTIQHRQHVQGSHIHDVEHGRALVSSRDNKKSGFTKVRTQVKSCRFKEGRPMMDVMTVSGKTIRMKFKDEVSKILLNSIQTRQVISLSVQYSPNNTSQYYGWFMGIPEDQSI